VSGNPSETVVYYAAGQRAKAQRLLASLSGSVVIGQAPTPPGADLVLVSGGDLKVAAPPPPPAAPGTTHTTPTQNAAGAPRPSGATTPAQAPLPAFNPTACPPGSNAVAAR
jgi:hypothetical protein